MKNNICSRALLSLAVISTHFAAQAAETVPPVIVTATRTTQIADESVAPVIVIDQQTLAQNPDADIADLLRMYAGIEISRYGGPGQNTSMFIRGANSNQTLVMIDGVKINSGTSGAAALQNIDLSMVDHIEVVMGPRSTLYGSEAIGGVINIITRRQTRDGSSYQLAAGGGSYDTRDIRLHAYNKQGDRAAGLEASYIRSDGFPSMAASTIDNGYHDFNLHVYGSKHIGVTDYGVSHWRSSGKTEYLSDPTTPLSQDYVNTTTIVTAKTPVNADWASTLKLGHISDNIDQNQDDPYLPGYKDYAHTSRYTLDWQNDVQWQQRNLLTMGLYYAEEYTAALSYGTRFDTSNNTSAAFVQNAYSSQVNTLITGVRFNHNQVYGDFTTWNLEYGLNLGKSLRLTLAGNTGFRAPNSTDQYGFGGNPLLNPEKSQNTEIGLRYQLSKAQSIGLNAYRNRITDLMVYNNLTNMLENIGRATITGSELIYNYRAEHWTIQGRATVKDPRNDIDGMQLVRRAKHAYSLALGYHRDNYDIGLNAYYSGTRPDFNITTFARETLPAYTLVNFTAGYHFSRAFAISLRIENLGDSNYQIADGYNTPGRSAYAELRYDL